MGTKAQDENHKRFIKHLDESQSAVDYAKKYLESLGYEVRDKPETKKTPSYEERMKYVDDGDLYYYKDGDWRRVEVKHVSADFESAEDWPYKMFFVMAKHAWDKADPKPDVLLTFSKSMRHVASVKGDSYDDWFPVSFKDRRYVNYRQTTYATTVDSVKFSRVNV